MSEDTLRVFISYRRDLSQFIARSIFLDLRTHGYDVFMDVHSIDSGTFDTVIANQIAARPHFVLVLVRGSLDRCTEPDDWLRKEIEMAIGLQRNIVPVLGDNYTFKEAEPLLTGTLSELARYNALHLIHDYFDEGMERLRNRFLKQPARGKVLKPPTKEVDKALEIIDATVRLSDTQEKINQHIEHGNRAYRDGNYEQAVVHFNEAIYAHPTRSTLYCNRGWAHFQRQNWMAALEDFSKAVQLDSSSAPAIHALALTYEQLGEYAQAAAYYERTLQMDPSQSAAYVSLGSMLHYQGRYEEAIEQYARALLAQPSDGQAYLLRGESYFCAGRYVQALVDFKRARQYGADGARAMAGMAVTNYALKELDESVRYWRALLTQDGNYRDAEWSGRQLRWMPPLVAAARKLIAKV
ncbi:MAG: tetratricopeptide repeat protein [Chloroflexota bacterium]|nr:tetratricopeptide repeat protein [Chloroflexota bacterium]